MNNKLNAGDTAPDFTFDTPWEPQQRFYETAGRKTAVLFFLRYQGCPVCQMKMADIKQEIELFNAKGANVFVILQSAPDRIASLTEESQWPLRIVCDPAGDLFQLYSVAPGGVLKYMHPSGLVAAVKATFKGFRHGKFEGRETQLPAAFVVAPDRRIMFAYYGKTISDVPAPATIAAET